MGGRKKDFLALKPSGAELVGTGIQEYVSRNWIRAGLQYPSYWLKLQPFWVTEWLKVLTPSTMQRTIAQADAVIVDNPFMYPAARKAGARPVVLNTHNVEADLVPPGWQKQRVAATELAAARRADAVVCCSARDRDHFAGLIGKEKTLVVPNGIDVTRFAHLAPMRAAQRQALGLGDDAKIVLFPASFFGPNQEGLAFLSDFAEREAALMQRLKLHFVAVGSVSKTPWQKPGLIVTGPVPKVEPYFAAADLAINAVLRGSGTNVKMCEFMAAGLPVFTTEPGTRGFQLTDQEDCVVYAPETLAATLAATPLLQNPAAAARMAANALAKNRADVDMSFGIMPLVAWLKTKIQAAQARAGS